MGKNLLAVDIGGTSSRFAHFSLHGRTLALEKTVWLETGKAKSFGDLLQALTKADFSLTPQSADHCIFAVAGPVEEGVLCAPPNIKWNVDLRNAKRDFGFEHFSLINDFLAQACACASPIAEQSIEVVSGTAVKNATIGVVGAGTGLGKAFLVPDGKGGFLGSPSEGGHANFSAENARELEFQRFAEQQKGGGYLTWEDAVCGRGLSTIHEFLTGDKLDPKAVAATFSPQSETLQWGARFYGRVCRNFALETLAVGGIFLAGGVAAKNPTLVQHEEFKKAFHDSRVHGALLKRIPVRLIDNQESGLWGGAYYGMQKLLQTG